MKKYIVRKFQDSDLKEVIRFFKKAYGEDTVFSDERFLRWYYSSPDHEDMMSSCIIALNEKNEVVSYYGGLNYFLKINNRIEPIVWGVNAFTLVEDRGNGINSKIVDSINREFNINGIIGFKDKTAKFYNSIDYNIFEYQKFKRFVRVINIDKTKKILEKLGFTKDDLDVNSVSKSLKEHVCTDEIIKLNEVELESLEIDFSEAPDLFATTYRDKEFINRRILKNPFIEYEVFGLVRDNKLKAYIVYRKEMLIPMDIIVNRIVDLFGSEKDCEIMLNFVINESIKQNCAYLEFSMFGSIYHKALEQEGFYRLLNEESEMIPFCSAPMERRSDNERIGFSSILNRELVFKMNNENIYFTRIDSDRDRLSKISQIC